MSTRTTSFYNKYSFLYPVIDIFLRSRKKRLFQEINDCPFGNLLEIGVGNGAHFGLYRNHRITGIDNSSGMLELAEKCNNGNISLHEMNALDLKFDDETFDYVVVSHVLTVVEDPDKLIMEAHRVLKPGGRMFILNHVTPRNGLQYLDHALSPLTKMLRFQSVFYTDNLVSLNKFEQEKEIGFGPFSYIKLMVFCKNNSSQTQKPFHLEQNDFKTNMKSGIRNRGSISSADPVSPSVTPDPSSV